jgi:hypothetical protein
VEALRKAEAICSTGLRIQYEEKDMHRLNQKAVKEQNTTAYAVESDKT